MKRRSFPAQDVGFLIGAVACGPPERTAVNPSAAATIDKLPSGEYFRIVASRGITPIKEWLCCTTPSGQLIAWEDQKTLHGYPSPKAFIEDYERRNHGAKITMEMP